jgi:colicin import membrane protein
MNIREQLIAKQSRGRLRAFFISLFIHGLLALMLLVGVSWRTQTPEPVQIEIFSPPPVAVVPMPDPQKIEPPQPKVEPTPPTKPVVKPDLTLEKQKEAERKAVEQKEAERKTLEAKAKERQLKEEKLREEKLKETKANEAKDREKLEAAHQERIKKLQQQAGAAVGAQEGSKSGTVDADYAGRLRSLISRNTVFSGLEVDGNPQTNFIVELSPDCAILKVTRQRSSGSRAWDEAAERAIRRSDPFPKPRDGGCPAKIEVSHRPKSES